MGIGRGIMWIDDECRFGRFVDEIIYKKGYAYSVNVYYNNKFMVFVRKWYKDEAIKLIESYGYKIGEIKELMNGNAYIIKVKI